MPTGKTAHRSIVVLAIPLLLASPAAAQTMWTGADPDDPASWFDSDNWSGGVPSSSSDAWIDQFEPAAPVIDAPGAAAETVVIGMEGDAELQISAGGTLQTDDAYLGMYIGSGGDVVVSGMGSTWMNSGLMVIGDVGRGGLRIEDGGKVETGNAILGQDAGAGEVVVTGASSIWSIAGELTIGGNSTALVQNGATLIVGGGSGTIRVTNDSDTPAGQYLMIGGLDTEAPGEVEAGTIELEAAASQLIFSHSASDYVFDPVIHGVAGSEITVKRGYTELTADSSGFEGSTYVYQTGTLALTGALGGWIEVSSEAILTGDGTVQDLEIDYGGTLSPGMGVGTLHVDGDLAFLENSLLLIEVDPLEGTADHVHVTGTATLEAGIVHHVGLDSTYPLSAIHTILTADGGVTGTFEDATSDFVFLDPVLFYDPNNVYLQLRRNDTSLASLAKTDNQRAVAAVLDEAGIDHPVHSSMLPFTDVDEIASTLGQISGESHASFRIAPMERDRHLGAILSRRFGGNNAVIMPLAFNSAPMPALAPAAALTGWTSAWGGDGRLAAGPSYGYRGALVGMEWALDESWRAGAAMGIGEFSVHLSDSSFESHDLDVALYAAGEIGPLRFGSAVLHSRHEIDSSRRVEFADVDQVLAASFGTETTQLLAEIGYAVPAGPGVTLIPFAGINYLHHHVPGYSESGGTAQLTVNADSTDLFFAMLGIRSETELSLGATLATLRLGAGWHHGFGDGAAELGVSMAEASPFVITGAGHARDEATIEAELNLRLAENTALATGYRGSIASGGGGAHSFRLQLSVALDD